MRDNRGKAKQVTTFNGRTVIIKENSIYSNKGGRLQNRRGNHVLTREFQASNPLPKLSSYPTRFTTHPHLMILGHGLYTTFRGH